MEALGVDKMDDATAMLSDGERTDGDWGVEDPDLVPLAMLLVNCASPPRPLPKLVERLGF